MNEKEMLLAAQMANSQPVRESAKSILERSLRDIKEIQNILEKVLADIDFENISKETEEFLYGAACKLRNRLY